MNKKIRYILTCTTLILCSALGVGCSNPTPKSMNNDLVELNKKVELLENELDSIKKDNVELRDKLSTKDDNIRFYNIKSYVKINKHKSLNSAIVLELEYEFDNKTGKAIDKITGEVNLAYNGETIVTELETFNDLNLDTGRNTVIVKSFKTLEFMEKLTNYTGYIGEFDIRSIEFDFTPVNVVFNDGTILSQ